MLATYLLLVAVSEKNKIGRKLKLKKYNDLN
jgi:hypothetical protein